MSKSIVNLSKYIGLYGVDPNERPLAIKVGNIFNFAILCLVIWLAIELVLDIEGFISQEFVQFFDILLFLFFLFETSLLTLLVYRKLNYLKNNWLNLFIIAIGFPLFFWDMTEEIFLLRIIRVALIFGLLLPHVNLLIRFLTDRRLDTSLGAAFIIVIFSGLIITGIEPEISRISDGIWWAWVSISTVGYGDVVPSTIPGRIFGSILILIGMGLFAVITANFSALLIERKLNMSDEHQLQEDEIHFIATTKKINEVIKQQKKIEKTLYLLEKKLGQMEQSDSKHDEGTKKDS